MSQEWLDIQSFFADNQILRAITDLSLATKYELAGICDEERARRAGEAKGALRQFFVHLDQVCDEASHARPLSLDHRSRELVDAIQAARCDRANFRSVLMRSGLRAGAELLDASDRRSREALLESLDELRRVVSRHQQGSLSAIVEDF
ncbi:MAG: hypothetical protein JSU86_03375 [Phycisphaerales bacterium]|nr:MAG: hypothetical protein JSU86_03375 [Phycisphaerales bacterium]